MNLPATNQLPLRSGPQVIARPRLLARLNTALHCPLILITAPAGYGKSSLLASWIAECGADREGPPREAHPTSLVASLSLDDDDNLVRGFLGSLLAALHRLEGFSSPQASALATLPEPPARALLRALLADLSALPAQVRLVLDDFHIISEPQVHDLVAWWLAHMPPNVRLLIAGRTTPPLPLSRLRSRGLLSELGTAELQFTQEETATFLREVMGLQLSDAAATALHGRTGGWAAGLQLAALSLRAQPGADPAALLASLIGNERLTFAYLYDEVLRHLPADIQRFLLQTAVLSELHEPLCDAVTDTTSAHTCLSYLLANQLFVVPVEPLQPRYRYHPLFHDLLRSRLRQSPEQIPALHRRAASWYERSGQLADAVEHSLLAGDSATVVRLLERHGEGMWTQAEMRQVCHWLPQLPETVRAEQPRLLLLYSWALLMCGQPAQAEACLEGVAATLGEQQSDPELSGLLLAIQAPIQALRDPGRALDTYRAADRLLPPTALGWRSAVALGSGFAQLAAGDLLQAGLAFERASALCQEVGNRYAAIYAIYYRGRVMLEQGQLTQALATFERAIEAARGPDSPSPLLVSWGLLGRAEVRRERNELRDASADALEALRLGQQRENAETISYAYLTLARIDYALGRLDSALALLDRAEAAAQGVQLARALVEVRLQQARLWLAKGNLPAAARIAAELDAQVAVTFAARQPLALLHARLRIATRQARDAETDLLRLLKDRPVVQLEAHILLAMCRYAAGDHRGAAAALRPALVQGRIEGYRRLVLDEGPALAALMRAAMRSNVEAAWAQSLLQEHARGASDVPSLRPALVEALSTTEQVLLQLVAAGLTNQEIAHRQHISLNTVKWHLKNIYGKLGVRSRTAALVKARELKLLTDL